MDSIKRELNETKKKEKNSEQNVRELQQFIEHFRQQQGKFYFSNYSFFIMINLGGEEIICSGVG